MNKTLMLHWAEVIDSWRLIPRLFLLASFLWAIHVTQILLVWYMMLPKEDRGIEATGFASVVFVTVTGFLKLVFDNYVRNGRDWNNQPISTTTVATAQTTTTIPAGTPTGSP